jgi:hypothetical protein
MAFQIARVSSYPESPGWSNSPLKDEANFDKSDPWTVTVPPPFAILIDFNSHSFQRWFLNSFPKGSY